MTKYSLETKLAAVHAYLQGGDSFKETAHKHSVTSSMLKEWVAKFRKHGEMAFQESYTNHSIEFKMDVLHYINETGVSISEAAAHFNVASPSTVWNWYQLFETQGIEALRSKIKGRSSMKKDSKRKQPSEGSVEALRAENERLRMENAYLKKLQGLNSRRGKITEQVKAEVIDELRQEYKVIDLVEVAGIPRSTYYYWMKQKNRADKYHEVKAVIQQIFNEHQGRYGYRRIRWELQNQGYSLNHKTVRRLMNKMKIKSLVKVKKYRSYRGNVGKIAPNVIARKFQAVKPNEKWVTDVTEIQLHGEKLYLSPVLDLYNGEIVAYQMEHRPVYSLVSKMLDKAFKQLKENDAPILHSDQGWHYQMKPYQHALKEKNITQSMSRKGNCLDNAAMESFFGLLKSELLYLKEFESMEHFKKELEQYIDYYNKNRIKAKLKGMSPVQYRTHAEVAA
ncbi:IS3 family transposase [Fictibacillus sp. S7]|uniref:IS3 family transposase n=1 Tax=Fictibacillus sp. S7 TaxID=2212476 RepID=UPI0010116CF6|nr:IS3 family transposase [Fictibacillus sp. S7]RXZ00934.1 IS3 family transposase [Fictibacillus sp. S7]